MIESATELQVTARHLTMWKEALRLLREQLQVANPELLAITEKAYVRRIASLERDIADYLYEHPADVSLILPPAEPVAA